MSDSNPPREAFKVRIGDYLSEHELEGLGVSADWFLYLSPTIRPALATCFTQFNTYELLACPCCGGAATIIGTYPTNEFSAICRDCGLETAHKLTPNDAASDWNKRHAPDEEGSTPPESGGQGEAPVAWLEPHHLGAMRKRREEKEAGYILVEVCDSETEDYSVPLYTHPPGQASGAVTEALQALAERWETGVILAKWKPGLDVAAKDLREMAAALAQGGGNER